jgi:hypothetical protein
MFNTRVSYNQQLAVGAVGKLVVDRCSTVKLNEMKKKQINETETTKHKALKKKYRK